MPGGEGVLKEPQPKKPRSEGWCARRAKGDSGRGGDEGEGHTWAHQVVRVRDPSGRLQSTDINISPPAWSRLSWFIQSHCADAGCCQFGIAG